MTDDSWRQTENPATNPPAQPNPQIVVDLQPVPPVVDPPTS